MTDRISTFVNHDGQTVHAVYIDTNVGDGRVIERHQGTFATRDEASERISKVRAGWRPSFWEDEPE
jgi:hypothetical protein